MTTPLGLERAVDRRVVETIAEIRPDELAPQLSVIIQELVRDETEHIRRRGLPFIKYTILTETFKEVLKKIFNSLRNDAFSAMWLNLNMGCGKTHLLVLLTYLIYSYDYLKEELEEYRSLGLDEELAKETALFVVDFRTPAETPSTFLPFFVKSLEKVEEYEAAGYVESCIREHKMPEASELVRRLKKKNTKFIVIIDELHHAVLTYRGSPTERRWVKDTIEFVISLINYMRHYGRGFVTLVASARRDYELVKQLSEKDEQILLAENLLSQMGRSEAIPEARWLSVQEARKIILKRLGARQDVIHGFFDGFIERIIKAESDIPQAQHLRSLIKAMAIFTLNAINKGHSIVTPLAFSEKVINTLFPEGGGIADTYKSAYGHARRIIEEYKVDSNIEREIALLAVNAIFTASITGKSDILIEIIRAYKTGRYSGSIPAISEHEVEDLLRDVGFRDLQKISKALEIINDIEFIHSVKRGNTYIYFAVPIVNVVAVYNKGINERYENLLANREELIDRFVSYLHTIVGLVDETSQIIVVNSFEDLEKITKGLNQDKMYLIIYADPELIKFLYEKVRSVPTFDAMELNNWVKQWMLEKDGQDLSSWLETRRRHNIALTIPVPFEDVLRNIARYYAVEEATAKVVNDYLLEFIKERSRLQEEVKRLIEVELEEIHNAIENRLVEALSLFIKAYSKALSYVVYVYTCSFEPPNPFSCEAPPKGLGGVDLDDKHIKQPIRLRPERETYNKLIDTLCGRRDTLMREMSKGIVERVKALANFIDDLGKARSLITLNVVKSFSEGSEECRLSRDMNTVVYGSKIIYIPPSIVEEVVKSISAKDIEEKLMDQSKISSITIVKKEEGKMVVFEKKTIVTVSEVGKAVPQLVKEREVDQITDAIRILDSYERGEVHMVLTFDKFSRNTIKTYINALRKYIKKLEAKPL